MVSIRSATLAAPRPRRPTRSRETSVAEARATRPWSTGRRAARAVRDRGLRPGRHLLAHPAGRDRSPGPGGHRTGGLPPQYARAHPDLHGHQVRGGGAPTTRRCPVCPLPRTICSWPFTTARSRKPGRSRQHGVNPDSHRRRVNGRGERPGRCPPPVVARRFEGRSRWAIYAGSRHRGTPRRPPQRRNRRARHWGSGVPCRPVPC